MKKLIKKILGYINWFLAILLILANLSVFISPEQFWPAAFLGLLFPFLLILNFAFGLYWALNYKRMFLLPLIALVVSWSNVQHTFQFRGKDEKALESSRQELTLLTYNVQVFNLLGSNTFGKEQEQLLQFLLSKDPDVICLQEFYINPRKGLPLMKIDTMFSEFPHKHIYWISQDGPERYGIVIYSKYPILRRASKSFEGSFNASVYTDLKIGPDTLRIFNSHLQSIKFNRDNYNFITHQSRYNQKEKIEAIQDISTRLKEAFIKRSRQADYLSEQIEHTSYPTVVCGDFNDTPVSYSYRQIKGNLEDAFVNGGQHFGNTYVGKFPSYRIDFVFHSHDFETLGFEVPRVAFSDHYPIISRLALDKD